MGEQKNKKDKVKEGQVTYEMYREMPEDSGRFELLDGVLELMSPGPSATHQSIGRELEFKLMQSCRSDYVIFYAPLDVILSQTNVLQPDLMMIHRSRLHIVTDRGVEGAPDLVVEIMSPGSRKRDKVLKMRMYARHGVPEYWIVDAVSRTLEQYRIHDGGEHYILHALFEGDDVVTSDKLPCVSFVVSDIFIEMWS